MSAIHRSVDKKEDRFANAQSGKPAKFNPYSNQEMFDYDRKKNPFKRNVFGNQGEKVSAEQSQEIDNPITDAHDTY